MRSNKKAISPFVAAVILIIIVVAIGVLLAGFIRGFFTKQTGSVGDHLRQFKCTTDINFEISELDGIKQIYDNGQTITATLSNTGFTNLTKFFITVFGTNGTSEGYMIGDQLGVGQAKNQGYFYHDYGDIGTIEYVEISVIVEQDEELIVCTNVYEKLDKFISGTLTVRQEGEIVELGDACIQNDSCNSLCGTGLSYSRGINCYSDSKCINVCEETYIEIDCGEVVNYMGEIYPTVQIGFQCWFAKNLNINHSVGDSWCYGDNSTNCDVYGKLYNWEAAMNGSTSEGAKGLCPDGWHVPTDEEWHILEEYLWDRTGSCNLDRGFERSCDPAGAKLKKVSVPEDTSWNNISFNCDVTNSPYAPCSGFDALPAGFKFNAEYMGFGFISQAATFWSSTPKAFSDSAKYFDIRYDEIGVMLFDGGINTGLSVRCIKD